MLESFSLIAIDGPKGAGKSCALLYLVRTQAVKFIIISPRLSDSAFSECLHYLGAEK